MRFYKYLYISEKLEKKKAKILRKLQMNKFQLAVQLVVLPMGKNNQLEIINSQLLLQPSYPRQEMFVVAIVSGYDEAIEFVEKTVSEVYDKTGGADVRSYILRKEQED